MNTTTLRQGLVSQCRDNLELIPPLADEFFLYDDEITDRARKWALDWHYLLATGVAPCAHGLYLMPMCPASCLSHTGQLDHAAIWVPDSPSTGRPFLLAHPYASEVKPDTYAYAQAHGLDLRSDEADGWYHPSAIPVAMRVPASWPTWPIEAAAAVMLTASPVPWPEDPEDELVSARLHADLLAERIELAQRSRS